MGCFVIIRPLIYSNICIHNNIAYQNSTRRNVSYLIREIIKETTYIRKMSVAPGKGRVDENMKLEALAFL